MAWFSLEKRKTYLPESRTGRSEEIPGEKYGVWAWRIRWLVEDILVGIKGLAVNLHHIVQMRARRKTATTHEPDNVASLNALTFLHQRFCQVTVECFDSKPVIKFHHVAQLRVEPHRCHATLCWCLNRCISRCSYVQPVVPSWFFSKR